MTDAPERIWKRTAFRNPDQIGWHSGPWSIYSKTDDGPCVMSSGGPHWFGPKHYPSVAEARAALTEWEAAKGERG